MSFQLPSVLVLRSRRYLSSTPVSFFSFGTPLVLSRPNPPTPLPHRPCLMCDFVDRPHVLFLLPNPLPSYLRLRNPDVDPVLPLRFRMTERRRVTGDDFPWSVPDSCPLWRRDDEPPLSDREVSRRDLWYLRKSKGRCGIDS